MWLARVWSLIWPEAWKIIQRKERGRTNSRLALFAIWPNWFVAAIFVKFYLEYWSVHGNYFILSYRPLKLITTTFSATHKKKKKIQSHSDVRLSYREYCRILPIKSHYSLKILKKIPAATQTIWVNNPPPRKKETLITTKNQTYRAQNQSYVIWTTKTIANNGTQMTDSTPFVIVYFPSVCACEYVWCSLTFIAGLSCQPNSRSLYLLRPTIEWSAFSVYTVALGTRDQWP